ncbi:hypothetical protein NDU88_006782 [Pleurodeles waltl]|uniref:Uncharacterized protein n=1 Tax=Pleurodeles waltl TaxID=8319 RepID=A0AAV7SQJ4_PLEWA|nr:hypothetical protein NDU88_006782 [Pleurodeles waltl]
MQSPETRSSQAAPPGSAPRLPPLHEPAGRSAPGPAPRPQSRPESIHQHRGVAISSICIYRARKKARQQRIMGQMSILCL